MKLLILLLATTLLSFAAVPVASAQAGEAKEKFVVTRITVEVGETGWVSTGVGTYCTSAVSDRPAIATAAPNDGIFRGGFDVNGVAPGETYIDYTWTHGGKTGNGRCIVTVIPAG